MSTANKYMQSASGAGGDALNVEGVFSTYLYIGNGSTQTITNGIDLDGEGGLVWIKSRSHSYPHNLYDTERGATKRLKSASTTAESTLSTGLTAFSSTGFTLGGDNDTNGTYSDAQYASWTFRKAEKFFDVVTYTGNGTAGRTVSHNLGAVPGMIIVKNTSTGASWSVFHRSRGANKQLYLNLDAAEYNDTTNGLFWDNTAPTSTEFTVGTNDQVNGNTYNYVAYLFAHNNNDGDFGPDADQDIIKCGSYTGNGNDDGPEINLGFEPQWVMVKNTTDEDSWYIFDVMRGMVVAGTDDAALRADSTLAETGTSGERAISPTPTGFKVTTNQGWINNNNTNLIYMAIRRGPMAVPESGTEVFDIDVSTASQPYSVTTSLNYVDATINRVLTSGQAFLHNRLTGSNWMFTDSTNAESNSPNDVKYDFNGKVMPYFYISGDSHVNYMWKRAPNYMDVVAYTGNGTAGRTVSHNLGVAPEMMWVKFRSGGTSGANWTVYHAGTPVTRAQILLNLSNAASADNVYNWNNTSPTSTEFTLGAGGQVNANTDNYIAYLFASLAGISKVGSVTHSGTTNVDCGFTSGARFVLLKRTDATGDWYVWDSERGIVSGNDPYFLLNTNAAQVTNTDYIDPLSSGFTITSGFTAGDYIFYAIA